MVTIVCLVRVVLHGTNSTSRHHATVCRHEPPIGRWLCGQRRLSVQHAATAPRCHQPWHSRIFYQVEFELPDRAGIGRLKMSSLHGANTAFHTSLTQQYRVAVGSDQNRFATLSECILFASRANQWRVLSNDEFETAERNTTHPSACTSTQPNSHAPINSIR